jgi:hypothetical protein
LNGTGTSVPDRQPARSMITKIPQRMSCFSFVKGKIFVTRHADGVT